MAQLIDSVSAGAKRTAGGAGRFFGGGAGGDAAASVGRGALRGAGLGAAAGGIAGGVGSVGDPNQGVLGGAVGGAMRGTMYGAGGGAALTAGRGLAGTTGFGTTPAGQGIRGVPGNVRQMGANLRNMTRGGQGFTGAQAFNSPLANITGRRAAIGGGVLGGVGALRNTVGDRQGPHPEGTRVRRITRS